MTNHMRLMIVTGLSGSGKSIAIRQLEDCGYYCVDNLPGDFLSAVVSHLKAHGLTRVAVAIDARSQINLNTMNMQLKLLADQGTDVRLLFLTASTPELVQRFSETRRRHPLSLPQQEGSESVTLSEAIARERELLSPVALLAHTIDTSGLLPNTLRDWVKEIAQADASHMTLAFESFAFKRGIPVAADLVFDVRNLPNPFYDKALRPLTGKDAAVAAFLDSSADTQAMVEDISRFIERWLPSYEAQNRHYLTVAIGCTGGQHRSVYVCEALARRFASLAGVIVRHRQLVRETSR